MCVGEKRIALIPAGYGWDMDKNDVTKLNLRTGRGKSLPKGADLEIELELVAFKDSSVKEPISSNFFKDMDSNKDGRVTHDEMALWFQHQHPRKRGIMPQGLWERQDRNMDGFVTWDEFKGPKGEHSEL
jgi:hypothetical protein